MPDTQIVPAGPAVSLAPLGGTSKHRPIKSIDRPTGVQLLFRFPNGFGASLVNARGSYGNELAVIRWEGDDYDLTYETPLTDGVLGWLDADGVEAALDQIAALPAKEIER